MEGWLSRDPHTSDWILWSPATEKMYRRGEREAQWRASPESMRECRKLGREYADKLMEG